MPTTALPVPAQDTAVPVDAGATEAVAPVVRALGLTAPATTTRAELPVPRRVRRRRGLVRATAVLVELAVVVGTLAVAAAVGTPLHPALWVAVPTTWLVLVGATSAHAATDHLGSARSSVRQVVRAGTVLALSCWVASAFVAVPASPRQLVALTGAVTGVAVVHRLTWAAARAYRSDARPRLLVAGTRRMVDRVLAEIERLPQPPFDVAMVCVPRPVDPSAYSCPVTVGLDRLVASAVEAQADGVLVVPSRHLGLEELRRVAWRLEADDIQLYVGTGVLDVGAGRTRVASAGDLGLLHLRHTPRSGVAVAVKRAADWTTAAVALVLCLPLLAVIALAVRLDSPGAVVFRQERVGRGGAMFTMLKFRTMHSTSELTRAALHAANEQDAVLFKIRADPRITRVGRVLRRYSLDELPQLANVLMGQMSLVGPRPALPDEVSAYDVDPQRRLAVKPGITGLWQVSGRSDLTWEQTVRLDLHYVDNWSLGLDLRILVRTVRAVVSHRGAY